MHAKTYEFPDITWHRKMMILLWCLPFSFVVAVVITTLSFILFVEPADGRDEFMREVIRDQELNEKIKSL